MIGTKRPVRNSTNWRPTRPPRSCLQHLKQEQPCRPILTSLGRVPVLPGWAIRSTGYHIKSPLARTRGKDCLHRTGKGRPMSQAQMWPSLYGRRAHPVGTSCGGRGRCQRGCGPRKKPAWGIPGPAPYTRRLYHGRGTQISIAIGTPNSTSQKAGTHHGMGGGSLYPGYRSTVPSFRSSPLRPRWSMTSTLTSTPRGSRRARPPCRTTGTENDCAPGR